MLEMEAGKIKLAGISVLSCILLLGFTWMGSGEFTPVEDPEQLVEKLNINATKIGSIKSRFIQKKQLEFLDETITSKGMFWFRKENSLRWAYEEPFEYTIIINGGKFLIKDDEKVSAYDIDSNAAFREINDLIIGMVQGIVMEQDKFDMKAFEDDDQYLVKLVPKDSHMRSVISNMEIYFDKGDLTVTEIIMKESENDYTVITFFDKQINETIPDSVFTTDF
jgi:outer membrane lipoprotein-sorting protein